MILTLAPKGRGRVLSRAVLVLGLLLAGASVASSLGSGLGTEEFAERRKALAARLEKGVLILQDEVISRKTVEDADRNTPKYDFWYLTGWEQPGSIFMLRAEPIEAALFVPGKMGRAKGAAKKTGLATVLPLKAFPKTFQKWAADAGGPVWTKGASPGGGGLKKQLEGLAPEMEIREVGEHLVKMRLVKSEAEKAAMREVVEIGARGLLKVIPKIRPGLREGDVAKAIEKSYEKLGAQRLSFPSIVGSGKNGTIIHYTENAAVMKAGDIAVIDVGAELHHYASDISRTVPVSGRFTPRQREVYQAVLEAQAKAEEALKPGATLQDLHKAADEVIRGKGFPAIPHFVGHFVGLSVHDSGTGATPLRAGMVITIEPGIYLKDEGIGVRIEDMYLVTPTGFERLSEDIPRSVEEIEALRKGK